MSVFVSVGVFVFVCQCVSECVFFGLCVFVCVCVFVCFSASVLVFVCVFGVYWSLCVCVFVSVGVWVGLNVCMGGWVCGCEREMVKCGGKTVTNCEGLLLGIIEQGWHCDRVTCPIVSYCPPTPGVYFIAHPCCILAHVCPPFFRQVPSSHTWKYSLSQFA